MGFFSSIGSAFNSISSSEPEKTESMASLRAQNGVKDFSSDMERMKNFDPEKELEKDTAPPSRIKKSTTSVHKK